MKKVISMQILTAIYMSFVMMGLILQSRFVMFFGHEVSLTIFVYPIFVIVNSIVAEAYGFWEGFRQLIVGLLLVILSAVIFEIAAHISYPANNQQYAQGFDIAMQPMLHNVLSAALGLIIGSTLNIYLLAKSKVIFDGRYAAIRMFIAISIGEFLTCVISLFPMFNANFDLATLWHIIINEYVILLIYTVVLALPMAAISHYIRGDDVIKF